MFANCYCGGYRIRSNRRALRVDNKLRKTGNAPSSAGPPKLHWATSTGDWRYYTQTGSMEVDVVGESERVFG